MPDLCRIRGRIFEKCFYTTNQSTFKKEKVRDEHVEVARTRNWAECGSDEKMRWFALHPSFRRAQL